MGNSLSERAMLVSLQISQWTARKLDRTETSAVNRKHGLTVEAARVNKNLLPLATDLDRVHKISSAIRKQFDFLTAPWALHGVNILKSDAYMDFTGTVRGWQDEWHGAVETFLAAYPTYRTEARLLLNTMFNEDDYPSPEDLARRFAFNIRFYPLPDADDWRVSVGDEATMQLREQLKADVERAMGEAMQDVWRRIYEVVSKAHERLSCPDNKFKDSLVENAIELCAVLPSLNITSDPDLEQARRDVERSLCAHRPDTLRDDLDTRAQVADQMAEIMRKMSGAYQRAA